MMKKKLDNSNCSDTAEKIMPIVNFNNCGGKAACVIACPYDVFEMKPIADDDKQLLNIKGKIKTFFFKHKAYVVHPENCHSCGLCVQSCPEKAIKLTKYLSH